MRDYHNNLPLTKYLGIVTGRQFEKEYNDMANSVDMLPVASTLIPVTEAQGGSLYADDSEGHKGTEPLLQAWIFYQMKTQPQQQIQQPQSIPQPEIMI